MKFWLFQICIVLYISRWTNASNGCGRPNADVNRIVHGRDVGYLKYPWFATLLLASSKDRLMCGGSLVGPRHILTAAHCFKPFLSSVDAGRMALEDIYHVKLGVNNICLGEASQEIFSTNTVHIHEKYRSRMPYYDIALLELDRDANFTQICLPKSSYNDSNRPEDGLIVGLGKESSNSWRLPCTVKEARVLVYNDTICREMLDSMKEDSSELVNAFCAGYLEGGIDSCQGDSGGPLQTINPATNLYELDGVTSFGFGCAAKGVLGVYTDVSHYLDWIHEKINQKPMFNFANFIRQHQLNTTNSYPIEDETNNKAVTEESTTIKDTDTDPILSEAVTNESTTTEPVTTEPITTEPTTTTESTTSTEPTTTSKHSAQPHRKRRVHRRHRNMLNGLLNL